ncbi:MAG: methyltransferase domain-containing protein [Catalinimonas sp.]
MSETPPLPRPGRQTWYTEWFDSPYYHLLYQNRDDQEAQRFIDHLVRYLDVAYGHRLLDLACGKGRHAIYLNKLGFNVMGVDLSRSNIALANWFINERLKFRVHDMRRVVKPNYFHFILNLFTSFGYFDDPADDEQAMHAAAQGLLTNGRLIVDFMNTPKVLRELTPVETKEMQGVVFRLERKLVDDVIVKRIRFEDEGRAYDFQERVRALHLLDFERLMQGAGLRVEGVFGDYRLGPYDAERSDRIIIVARRTK